MTAKRRKPMMTEWRSRTTALARRDPLPAAHDTPEVDEIRQELGRMIGSGEFRDSLRLTSFITFVVEATLAGMGDRIKAYTIAVEAFGRGSNFDPQSDPIVRVEAGRLRQALAHYYAGAGRDDPLVIEVPRGTYVPVFRRRPQQPLAVPIESSIRGVITTAMDRMRGPARVFRIAIFIIGILAILQVAFDIDHPLHGGQNQGLFSKLWEHPTKRLRHDVAATSPAIIRTRN
jgi:hypothetical protein